MDSKNKAIIAICSDNKWPKCNVHPNFGRCSYINFVCILGDEIELMESVANPFLNASGAGISVASLIAEKKASLVIAGQFGPNASNALSKWGIKMFEATGDAKKVLLDLKVTL